MGQEVDLSSVRIRCDANLGRPNVIDCIQAAYTFRNASTNAEIEIHLKRGPGLKMLVGFYDA